MCRKGTLCVHWMCVHLSMSMCTHLGCIDLICFLINTVQFLSHIWLFVTPWAEAHQASLFVTKTWSLPNSCPLTHWCHPTISSSVVPFSSCLQYFPGSGSCPMSQLFTLGDQSTGVSASASVLPMNIQGWFLLKLTGLAGFRNKNFNVPCSQIYLNVFFHCF